MTCCVSYSRNMPKSTNPPYTATEYKPAPKAEVGGKNMDPGEEHKRALMKAIVFATLSNVKLQLL